MKKLASVIILVIMISMLSSCGPTSADKRKAYLKQQYQAGKISAQEYMTFLQNEEMIATQRRMARAEENRVWDALILQGAQNLSRNPPPPIILPYPTLAPIPPSPYGPIPQIDPNYLLYPPRK